jgi:hypothetical protein
MGLDKESHGIVMGYKRQELCIHCIGTCSYTLTWRILTTEPGAEPRLNVSAFPKQKILKLAFAGVRVIPSYFPIALERYPVVNRAIMSVF